MRMYHSLFLLLTTLLLLNVSVLCAPAVKPPGGATPAGVMTRLLAGMQSGNREEVARCFSVYLQSAETARHFADMILYTKVTRAQIIAGVQKYGADDFVKALSQDNATAIYFLSEEVPCELLLKHGKLKVTGATAVYSYQAKDKEALTTQPQLAAFEKALGNEGIQMTTIDMPLKKVKGRWFVYALDVKETDQLKGVFAALKEYVEQLRTAIANSPDAEALAAALTEPNNTLREKFTPETEN